MSIIPAGHSAMVQPWQFSRAQLLPNTLHPGSPTPTEVLVAYQPEAYQYQVGGGGFTLRDLLTVPPSTPQREPDHQGPQVITIDDVPEGEPSDGNPSALTFLNAPTSGQSSPRQSPQQGPGMYTCRFCPYSSDHRWHVIVHERTHSGEKPFVCKYCQRAFARGGHLRTHLRSHTKEMPYRCDACGQRFRYTSSYWRHQKRQLCHARPCK